LSFNFVLNGLGFGFGCKRIIFSSPFLTNKKNPPLEITLEKQERSEIVVTG